LPSVTTAWQCVIASCWMAVLTNVLCEQGECVKELHNTVMAENPLTTATAPCENANIVIESAVVAECVERQHPTVVGVVLLLGTHETSTTGRACCVLVLTEERCELGGGACL
jgi:hypothetical protein